MFLDWSHFNSFLAFFLNFLSESHFEHENNSIVFISLPLNPESHHTVYLSNLSSLFPDPLYWAINVIVTCN